MPIMQLTKFRIHNPNSGTLAESNLRNGRWRKDFDIPLKQVIKPSRITCPPWTPGKEHPYPGRWGKSWESEWQRLALFPTWLHLFCFLLCPLTFSHHHPFFIKLRIKMLQIYCFLLMKTPVSSETYVRKFCMFFCC